MGASIGGHELQQKDSNAVAAVLHKRGGHANASAVGVVGVVGLVRGVVADAVAIEGTTVTVAVARLGTPRVNEVEALK